MSLARDNSRVARQGLIVVSTAQALRDLVWFSNNPPDGVQILGAVTESDGGGGLWRWNAASTAADNLGTVLLPTGSTGAGRWVREVDGQRYNVLWFHDGSDDPGPAFQAAYDAAVSPDLYLAGQVGRVIYFPNKPWANSGGSSAESAWKWGSTEIVFEDSSTQAHINLETDNPTWIALTQNITSLIKMGMTDKARNSRVGGLKVDVAGNTLGEVIRIGSGLKCTLEDIECSDSAGGGSVTQIINQVAAGVNETLSNSIVRNLHDSGGAVVTNANLACISLNTCMVSNFRPSTAATASVRCVCNGTKTTSNTFHDLNGNAGTTGLTALLDVVVSNGGGAFSRNNVHSFKSNLTPDYGVQLSASNSAVIEQNYFDINDHEAAYGIAAFSTYDNHSLIRRNVYGNTAYNNGDPRTTGIWAGEHAKEGVLCRDTLTANDLYVYHVGEWRHVIDDVMYKRTDISVTAGSFVAITALAQYMIVEVVFKSNPRNSGSAMVQAASAQNIQVWAQGTEFEVTTGPLNGTTGTDGKVTLSAAGDGVIHLENRTTVTLNGAILQRKGA